MIKRLVAGSAAVGAGWAIYAAARSRQEFLSSPGCYTSYGECINRLSTIANTVSLLVPEFSDSHQSSGKPCTQPASAETPVSSIILRFRDLISSVYKCSLDRRGAIALRAAADALLIWINQYDAGTRQVLADCVSPDQWVALASACESSAEARGVFSLLISCGPGVAVPAGLRPPPYHAGRRAVPSRRSLSWAASSQIASESDDGADEDRSLEVSAHVAAAVAVAAALRQSGRSVAVQAATEQLPSSAGDRNGLSHADDAAAAAAIILAAAVQYALAPASPAGGVSTAADQTEAATVVDWKQEQQLAEHLALVASAGLRGDAAHHATQGCIPAGMNVALLRARCAAVDRLESLQAWAQRSAAAAEQVPLDPLAGWRVPAAAAGGALSRGIAQLCGHALRYDALVLEQLGLREVRIGAADGGDVVSASALASTGSAAAESPTDSVAATAASSPAGEAITLIPLSPDRDVRRRGRVASLLQHNGMSAFAACCSGAARAAVASLASSAASCGGDGTAPAEQCLDTNVVAVEAAAHAWAEAGSKLAAAMASRPATSDHLPLLQRGCFPVLHGALLPLADFRDASELPDALLVSSTLAQRKFSGDSDGVAGSIASLTGSALALSYGGDSSRTLQLLMHRACVQPPAAASVDNDNDAAASGDVSNELHPVPADSASRHVAQHLTMELGTTAAAPQLHISEPAHPLLQLAAYLGVPSSAGHRIVQLEAPLLARVLLADSESRSAAAAPNTRVGDAAAATQNAAPTQPQRPAQAAPATSSVFPAQTDITQPTATSGESHSGAAAAAMRALQRVRQVAPAVAAAVDSELRMLEDELGLPTRIASATGLSAGIAGASEAELRMMASPPAIVKAQLKRDYAPLLLPLPDQTVASPVDDAGNSAARKLPWPVVVDLKANPTSASGSSGDGGISVVQLTPSLLDCMLALSRNGGIDTQTAAAAALSPLLRSLGTPSRATGADAARANSQHFAASTETTQPLLLPLQLLLAQMWMLSTLHGVLADDDLPANARRAAAAEAERWRQRHEAATTILPISQSGDAVHACELPIDGPLRLGLFSDRARMSDTTTQLDLPPYVRKVALERLRARTRAGLLPPLQHAAYTPTALSLPMTAHTTKALAYLVGGAVPDDETQSLLFAHGIDLAALAEAEDGRVHPDADEAVAQAERSRGRIATRVLEQGASAPMAFLAQAALASLESNYARSAFVEHAAGQSAASAAVSTALMNDLDASAGSMSRSDTGRYDSALLSDLLLGDHTRVQVAILRQSLRLAANIGHSISRSQLDSAGKAHSVAAASETQQLAESLTPLTSRILAPLPGADWFASAGAVSASAMGAGGNHAAGSEPVQSDHHDASSTLVCVLAHRDAKTYSYALRCRANLNAAAAATSGQCGRRGTYGDSLLPVLELQLSPRPAASINCAGSPCSRGPQAALDIIAVHGLQGAALKAWRCPAENPIAAAVDALAAVAPTVTWQPSVSAGGTLPPAAGAAEHREGVLASNATASTSIPALWVIKRITGVPASPSPSRSSGSSASTGSSLEPTAALRRSSARRRLAIPMAFWPLHWLARDCAVALGSGAGPTNPCAGTCCHSSTSSPLRVIAVSYDADLMSGAGEHGVRPVRPVGRVAMDIRSQLIAADIGAPVMCSKGTSEEAASASAALEVQATDLSGPMQQRALLPLTHSFGGIMTKLVLMHTSRVDQAAVQSEETVINAPSSGSNGSCAGAQAAATSASAVPARLLDATCGIAFYGTPHRGVSLKAAASLISLSSRLARWAGGPGAGAASAGKSSTLPSRSGATGAVSAGESAAGDELRRPTAAEAAVAAAAAAEVVAAAAQGQGRAAKAAAAAASGVAQSSLASPALALLLDTAALTQLSDAFNAELQRRAVFDSNATLTAADTTDNEDTPDSGDASVRAAGSRDQQRAAIRSTIPVVCIAEGRPTSIPGVMGLGQGGVSSAAGGVSAATAPGTATSTARSDAGNGSWWRSAAKPVAAVASAAARSLAGVAAATGSAVSRSVLQVTIVPAANADAGAPGGHAIVVPAADHVQVCKPESPAVELPVPPPAETKVSHPAAAFAAQAIDARVFSDSGEPGVAKSGGTTEVLATGPAAEAVGRHVHRPTTVGISGRARSASLAEALEAAEDPRYGAALWLALQALRAPASQS